MNDLLRRHPAYRELLQALAELEMVSHAPTQSLSPTVRDTTESIGGKRPGGTDVDRPRKPKPTADPKEWEEFEEEREAWLASYHRRTPSWFRGEIVKCEAEGRLVALRDLCRETVTAWIRRPLPKGQAPESMADPDWKRWVAECGRDSGDLARQFGCTRRYVNKIKAMDWSTPREESAA